MLLPLALLLGAGAMSVAHSQGASNRPGGALNADRNSTLEGGPDQQDQFGRKRERTGGSANEPLSAGRKTFGNAPGAGASSTGFISTNLRRPKLKQQSPTGDARELGGARTPKKEVARRISSPPPLFQARQRVKPGADLARKRIMPNPYLVDLSVPGNGAASGNAAAGGNVTARANSAIPGNGSGLANGANPPNGIVPPNGSLGVGSAGVNGAFPPRKLRVVDETPFDPLGVRAGAFLLRPALETSIGYNSNPGRVGGAKGSAFAVVAPELLFKSDWVRHELSGALRGSYTTYEADAGLDRPTLDARINGRIDVTYRDRIDLEGRYLIGTDNPGSPDLVAGLARLPLFSLKGATAGYAHAFNRVELSAKGTFDRLDYNDSVLTNGASFSNADRNYTQYGTILRASYDLLPGMRPFVEASLDTRIRDQEIDRSGVRRNSLGSVFTAGTTFAFSPKLTGEIAIGYLTRHYADPSLRDLNGVVANAAVIWEASPLTNIKAALRSTGDESTLFGVSGVLRRDADLTIDHAFRRWLVGTARFGYGRDDYQGSDRHDDRMFASLALLYKSSRSLHVKGELRQEWLRSSVPGADYNASIALIGVRVQR